MSNYGYLSSADISRLAALHHRCLPDDILPMLGEDYLTSFYCAIASSPCEMIYVRRNAQQTIIGACIITLESSTIMRRMITQTIVPFLLASLKKYAFSREFRRCVAGVIKYSLRRYSDRYDPQITYIYVDPASRRSSVGQSLIRDAADNLLSRGYSRLYVKTLHNTDITALSFYQRHGFCVEHVLDFAGRRYAIMCKQLIG